MTRHNLFTWGFWVCVFVTGGLQALGGQHIGDFTGVIAILGMIEHFFAGKTTEVGPTA